MNNVCGQCEHFRAPEWCWRYPPAVYASGFQRRPKVNVTESACGEFVSQSSAAAAGSGQPGIPSPQETREIVEKLRRTSVVTVDETPGPKYAPKHKKAMLKEN